MSIRERLKKGSSALQKRHKDQIKNKDKGGRYPSIIMKEKLPAGVELWRIKEDEHMIDIIPWFVGSNMPFGDYNEAVTPEGEPDYVLDISVHMNVGTMKEPFVCPYENFGEPCPICEYTKSHELPKDTWKDLRPKRRVLYLVWVHDNREQERKGIQLLEVSHFVMEEKIAEIAKLPKGGGAIYFSDPDKGKTIHFTRKGSGMKNTQYLGHKFIDREGPIPNKILEQAFPIDDVVHMRPTYEAIAKAFADQKKVVDKSLGVVSDNEAGSTFDNNSTGDMPDSWDDQEEEETTAPVRKKRRVVKKKTSPSTTGVKKRRRVRKK